MPLSEAQLAANRANALLSTGPKSPEGKAKSALNGLVHGLRAQTIIIPGEDPDVFEALRAALDDQFQPQNVVEQHFLDTMAAAQWLINRTRRHETAILSKNVTEAYAQYDAQQLLPKQPIAQQGPEPEPEPEPDLADVPWEDRCAAAAARLKRMAAGRQMFLERWHYLRGRMLLHDRPTEYLDEMLLMLGHRAGELVQGDPITEQVTLDWVSLWFTHDKPNRHRVSDAIYRCTSLRGIDLENETSRLMPKVPSWQDGQTRLLALIDDQIAELEQLEKDAEPEPEPESESESEPESEPKPAPLAIDLAAREAACAYALFDSSKEGMLRLRYLTAQDNIYNRALRNLLALRKQQPQETVVPSEAKQNGPPEPRFPSEPNRGASARRTPRPAWVEGPPSQSTTSPHNPPHPHLRK